MRRVLLAAAVAALVIAPAAQAWTWPADGPVLRPFTLGDDPYAGGQHRGIDVGGELGSPVRTPAAGTVSFAGFVPSGGKTVTIQTSDGYAVTLLQLGEILVMRGALVEEGALVGRIGPSSDAVTTEPHVHLGIRVAAEPEGYVDPLTLLPPRTAPAAEPEPPAEAPAPTEDSAETSAPPVEVPPAETPAAPAEAQPAPPAPATEEAAPPAAPAEPVAAEPVAEPPAAPPESTPAEVVAAPLPAESYPAPHAFELLPVRAAFAPELRPTARPQRVRRIRPTIVRSAPTPAEAVRTLVAPPAVVRAAPTPAGAVRTQARPGRAQPHPVPAVPRDARAPRVRHRHGESSRPWLPVILVALTVPAAALAAGALRAARGGRPIMGSDGSERRTEDPGRSRVAVRGGGAAPRSRGGLRRPGRHLRAVSPPGGQRRPDDQRDGRARDTGAGGGGHRGTIAA